MDELEELDKEMEDNCQYPGVDCYFCIRKPCLDKINDRRK